MSRKQPIQQPPPVQRLRIRYAKRGAARFTSHRDFGRALERALRRAEVPMAYSSGFHPHPRVSYANAAPTSAASEAEYLELALAERCDPAKVVEALNESLPKGFVVLDAADAVAQPLGELLQASEWRISLAGAPAGVLEGAVERFLAEESLEVERMTKKGVRTFDARAAVERARVVDDETLELRLIHGTPLVRPDDVLSALRGLEPAVPALALMTRLAQGVAVGDDLGDPLRPE